MDVFVARKPMFDDNLNVIAYELLYKGNNSSKLDVENQDYELASVIINSLISIGLDNITDKKRAYIKFTDTLLNYEIPSLLHNNKLIIEIMSDSIDNMNIVSICKELKKVGYKIAIDYCVLNNNDLPKELIKYLDIIKINFFRRTIIEREDIVKRLRHFNIKLLADGIENMEEYRDAIDMGYSYFQGDFFNKLEFISGKDIPNFKINSLHMINELNQLEPNFDVLTAICEKDISLCYKLLKLINSAAFNFNTPITSIKHSLVLLGFNEIRKFIYLILVNDMCIDKPDEIMRNALIRARFGELICNEIGMENRKDEVFLMELFSLIDVMLNKPIEDILATLPLTIEVKEALSGQNNKLYNIHNLIISYEKGYWTNFFKYLELLNIEEDNISEYFIQALEWTRSILFSC